MARMLPDPPLQPENARPTRGPSSCARIDKKDRYETTGNEIMGHLFAMQIGSFEIVRGNNLRRASGAAARKTGLSRFAYFTKRLPVRSALNDLLRSAVTTEECPHEATCIWSGGRRRLDDRRVGGNSHAQMRDRLEKISGNTVSDGIRKHWRSDRDRARQQPDARLIHFHHSARSIPFGTARPAVFQRKFLPTQGLAVAIARLTSRSTPRSAPVSSIRAPAATAAPAARRDSAATSSRVRTARCAPPFGLGLQEILGDEITTDLRAIRAGLAAAQQSGTLVAKGDNLEGHHYG